MQFSLCHICMSWASLVAQMVKHLPAMQETRVESLGWEDSLEKEMATHSGTLARKIPWTEEPGRLQTMGLQTVGHDRATSLSADGGGEAHPCGAFLRPLSMGCTPFPVSFCARDLATWPHTDCTGLGNDHPGQQPPQLSPSPAVNHLVSTLQVLFPLLLFSC